MEEKIKDEKLQEGYTKREIGLWEKEKKKLLSVYGGIYTLEKVPDALFIIDIHKEEAAVKEATRKGITIVGIVDTNADPALADYPIPANDDAVGSIQLITDYLVDAWLEGKKPTKETKETEGTKEKKEAKSGKRKSGPTKKTA